MATITSLVSPTTTTNMSPVQTSNLKTPYVVWFDVDFAAAVTAKGSALAVGDIIEAIRVPADHVILGAWLKKETAFTGTSTDLTLDFGVTGKDPDQYVDGWDFDAAAVGSYATPVGVENSQLNPTSDTLDILIATQTGTVTGGKVRAYAMIASLQTRARGAIAELKS